MHSACLFSILPLSLSFSFLNRGSSMVASTDCFFSGSTWACLVHWEFYSWIVRIQYMIRGLLNYWEDFAVLSSSLFLGDFLFYFFKIYRCRKLKRLIMISKEKWERMGEKGSRGNETSLKSKEKNLPREELWADCISLCLDGSILLIWKRGTSYIVVTEGSLGGGTMAETLARCSPGSRESCFKNSQYKNRVFRVWSFRLSLGAVQDYCVH